MEQQLAPRARERITRYRLHSRPDQLVSGNTVTVNTTQNISRLSGLTSNGFVKTISSNGTLCVDTATYLSCVNNLATVAVGNLNSVTGAVSSSFGYQNSAVGCAVSFGIGNTASGYKASALGRDTASGYRASAFGNKDGANNASGHLSTASGYRNTASATSSSAFGSTNCATTLN